MSPREEELLFNRFGAAYASDVARLLSLEWLHTDHVQTNLQKMLHEPDSAADG